jgi:hypothetical protein
MVSRLKEKHGLSEEEARDHAIHALLAPPEGRAILEDNPPKPIQGKEREAIYKKLEEWGTRRTCGRRKTSRSATGSSSYKRLMYPSYGIAAMRKSGLTRALAHCLFSCRLSRLAI